MPKPLTLKYFFHRVSAYTELRFSTHKISLRLFVLRRDCGRSECDVLAPREGAGEREREAGRGAKPIINLEHTILSLPPSPLLAE